VPTLRPKNLPKYARHWDSWPTRSTFGSELRTETQARPEAIFPIHFEGKGERGPNSSLASSVGARHATNTAKNHHFGPNASEISPEASPTPVPCPGASVKGEARKFSTLA
jgi:hypothetical protein